MKRCAGLVLAAACLLALAGCAREERANAAIGAPELMGFDAWYTEEGGSHVVRSYYADRGGAPAKIAESFGFEIDDYAVDLDGDGVTELVCNCVYGGDGHALALVYRRSGDGVERGRIDYGKLNMPGWDNWGANSTAERYDAESGGFVVRYTTEGAAGEERFSGLGAFAFEPYDPDD